MHKEENLTKQERDRYSRHLSLPDFDEASQLRLKNSSVIVIGAGGLGCPVLQYLAAAGIGKLATLDSDVVTLSNLQRQILFTEEDIGKPKATVAAKRLAAINSSIAIHPMVDRITSSNAMKICAEVDVIVDCTDNFATRYLINDLAILLGVPFVYGSVFRYEGHVGVFNYQGGTTYRDLFPNPPAPGTVVSCEEGGVLGAITGVIGSLQANEVIKVLLQKRDILNGKLLVIDLQTLDIQFVIVKDQNERKKITHLIDYEHFCNTKTTLDHAMKEVTVQELKSMMDAKSEFQLIDVREPHEFDICNLNGELIPQAEIPHNVDKISKDKKVIIHCRSGARSGNMVQWLEKNHGFTNLYNLKGGVLAWSKEIDPSMPTY